MQKYKLHIESLPEIKKSSFKFKLDKYIKKRDACIATLEENLKNDYFEKKWKQANPFYEDYNIISQITDIPSITENWLISYELINSFSLIPETSDSEYLHFNAAALPGDFLMAASHYAKSRCLLGEKYKWIASSINNEEDKMDSYQLYEKNKEKWISYTDIDSATINDGNLNNIETIKLISSKLRNSVDLYSLCPSNEKVTLGGVLCGLLCLREGANLVILLSSIESENSACLAALISAHFEESYLVVPQAAYSNNCAYIVAKKYRGIEDATVKTLFKLVSKNVCDSILFRARDIMPFLKNYQEYAKTILKKQSNHIENILEICGSTDLYNNLKTRDYMKKIDKWYILNPISPIF